MSALKDRIVTLTESDPELRSIDIAAKLGCHDAYVRMVWQENGIPRKRGPSNRSRILEPLTPANHAYLEREARQRGMTVSAFSRRLLNTIAESDLVAAILDDDE